MIEFSSEAVMGSTKESMCELFRLAFLMLKRRALLLLLLVFALMASGYVLVTGLKSGKRTQVQ